MRSLQELQSESLQILKMICGVCDKHGIRYYLGAGSLLGAVRHSGFIPWDDDIDVEFFREDLIKLVKLLREEMSDRLVIQDYKSDKYWAFPFAKVFLRNEVTEKLHYPELNRSGYAFVDLFPLVGCPRSKIMAKMFFKELEVFTVAAKSKTVPEERCGYSKWYARALFHFIRIFPIPVIQFFCMCAVSFFHRVSGKEYVCYPGGKYGYPYEIYRSEWYRTSEKMRFEDAEFNVPGAWDDILRYKYGDYMIPPDENNRQGHFDNNF